MFNLIRLKTVLKAKIFKNNIPVKIKLLCIYCHNDFLTFLIIFKTTIIFNSMS